MFKSNIGSKMGQPQNVRFNSKLIDCFQHPIVFGTPKQLSKTHNQNYCSTKKNILPHQYQIVGLYLVLAKS